MSATRRMEAPGNFRGGIATVGSRSSILNDDPFHVDEISTDEAVVLLLRRGKKFLSVSRGPDLSDMNLPGGKVEPGEAPSAAAKRELWEETGLIVNDVTPIYVGEGRGGRRVTVYKASSWAGNLRKSEEGTPDWVEADQLLSSTHGEFFRKMARELLIEL